MILSDHFKHSLKLLALLIVLLTGGYFWLKAHIRDVLTAPQASLPANDLEQIQVNPDTHQLTIRTSRGLKTITLPDRTSTIDIQKDGAVKVTSPQFGFEHHMFIGLLGSDQARLGAGIDGFYWKRLDIGVGIADQVGMYTPVVFAKATYTIKGSLQAGIVYQTNRYVGGILSVRVF